MLDLQKYKKVRAERDNAEDDKIIRVNRKSPATQFIDEVINRFTQHKAKEVVLSSLGAAISKTITVAEVVKHRVPGIHQLNEIKTIILDDAYEPLDEFRKDLKNETVSRKLTCFQIVLSMQASNAKAPGYQAPLPTNEVTPDQGPDDFQEQANNRGRRQRTPKKEDKPSTAEKPKESAPKEETKDGGAPKRRRNRRNRARKPRNPDAPGSTPTPEGGQKPAQSKPDVKSNNV